MISLDIPGFKKIEVQNVVFDFNGTIAEDGLVIAGVDDRIRELSKLDVKIFVLTADTNGTVKKECEGLPVDVITFGDERASEGKKKIVEGLGADSTVTIGNGRNDLEMFRSSVLSIAVIGKEGCFAKTLMEADIVVKSPADALELLLNRSRIKATLRA